MSKLYYHYGTMNAGKSINLIKDSYNYEELGRSVIVIKPKLDSRGEEGKISCRVEGMNRDAILFDPDENLFNKLHPMIEQIKDEGRIMGAVFVDEAQFMSREQVIQISHIPDYLDVPVMAYGLRTDAFGNLFEGSKAFFELADSLREIKTMCYHGNSKGIMVYRIDEDGKVIKEGDVIDVGGNDMYRACSRKEYKKHVHGISSVNDIKKD